MPRLIDDLRAPGARWAMPYMLPENCADAWADYCKKLRDVLFLRDLPVILADNVAEYYYAASDQEYWDIARDFPNLAPPYASFWVEHKLPSLIHSKVHGDTPIGDVCPKGRVGTIFTALEPGQWQGVGVPDNVRWVLWADLFIDYGKRDNVADCGHSATFFAVDKDGRLVDTPWMQTFVPTELAELMRAYMGWYHPSLLTISFLHCKNVRVDDNRTPAPLAKKYRAKHGVEPTTYKTLVIEPLKAILRKEGGAGTGNGLAKAMHICRGHFADYTEGRGLFGRYHGRYWIPATVRGTKGKTPAREIEVKV